MNSTLSGLLYFCILFDSISIGTLYGVLVDEGWVTPYIPMLFIILISLNMIYPSWLIYKKSYIGLSIYGVIVIIAGLGIRYYEYLILIKRGVGIYGNITPFIFITTGIFISSIALYERYQSINSK